MRAQIAATLKSVEFLGAVLFIFSVVFPPFDDLTSVDLSTHMLQHVLIILSGVMIAYPFYRRGAVPSFKSSATPKLVALACAAAIVYWHLPGPWDYAVLNPLFHVLEHFTFLLIGIAIGSVLQVLSASAKITSLLAAFFGHMVYAVILVAPLNYQVYPLYSVGDQAILGWTLLLSGWSFLVGVAYVLRGNPNWLAGLYGGEQSIPPKPKSGRVSRPRTGWVTLTVSLLLALALVGYFVATAAAVYGAPGSPIARGAVVYIVETPVSWQYSPQNIEVVLGVNNTVTWISHSVSYDTVTSNSGEFASGVIAPGGSYSYTFADPGVYTYRCIYHPWMVGTVTVVTSGK
jgi:plastocyanin